MAEINPCGWLQNAGATHTAAQLRTYTGSLLSSLFVSGSFSRTRGGVHPALGALLAVTQNGTPNMSVNVAAGAVYIPGTESTSQGVYFCVNDATVNLGITTAPGSGLNRIDLIVAKVQDSFYSGATDAWSLAVVTGTAAASPSAPTPPSNSVILAQVFVGSLVTSITNGNITDTRVFAAALGGILRCSSSARPTTPSVGDFVTETNTGNISRWDGSSWTTVASSVTYSSWTNYSPSWIATTTNPAIGNGTISGRYMQIGKTVHCYVRITAGSTTTFGSGDWRVSLPVAASSSNVAIGSAYASDATGPIYSAIAGPVSATTVFFVAGTAVFGGASPFAWTVSDNFGFSYTYEAA